MVFHHTQDFRPHLYGANDSHILHYLHFVTDDRKLRHPKAKREAYTAGHENLSLNAVVVRG